MSNKKTDRGPVLIFDFDGTVCDSFGASVEVMNQMAPRYGFRAVPEAKVGTLRGLSFTQFLNLLELPARKVPLVLHRGRREMKRNIGKLRPINGLPAALERLTKAGYTLGILTSNSKENVKIFLDANGLTCFAFVHAYSNLFGKSRGLRKVAASSEFKGRQLVYIGDEVRDVEACHAANVPVIAVTWGFNTLELLQEAQPQIFVHRPDELPGVVNQFFPIDPI